MNDKLYVVNMQAIKDCMLAISFDIARYYLGGVYIHDKGDKRHYCGTDGHILVHFEEQITGPKLDKGIIIKPLAKIKIGRGLEDADLYGTLQKIDEGTMLLKDNFQKIACDIINGTYPAYETVIPDPETPKVTAFTSFNANLLKTIQTITGKVGEQPRAIDNVSPNLWTGSKAMMNYHLVLMPMRI